MINLSNFYNFNWKTINKKIFFCFIFLFILGVFFSFSSTSYLASEKLDKNYYYYFQRHFLYALIGLFAMLVISILKEEIINKAVFPIFFILVCLLFSVQFLGVEVKGSRRWIDLYFFRLQPIELIKPFFVLTVCSMLNFYHSKSKHLAILFSFFVLSMIVVLLFLQPDIGQSVLLVLTWGSIIFIFGLSLFYIFATLITISSILALSVIIFSEKFSYLIIRINNFFSTDQISFQTKRALEAISLGGLTGQGMGEGILKDFVPEAHTDYVIAIISEEFGSIVSIMIVLIFLYIFYETIKEIQIAKKNKTKLILTGLISLLIFQLFIHLGVNTNILPSTGMTMPFISYGGSSLLGSGILSGLIINYTRKRFYDFD